MKTRRSRTQGLFQRGNIWWISYCHNGKRIRKGIGKNKVEAAAELSNRKMLIENGRDDRLIEVEGRGKKKLIGSVLKEYVDFKIREKKNVNCGYIVNRFESFLIKRNVLFLSDIKQPLIKEFQIYLKNDIGLKNASVTRSLGVIKNMFNFSIERQYTKDNPVRGIKYEKGTRRDKVLTSDEKDRLLQACGNNYKLKAAIILSMNLGLRRSELLGLEWDSISFDYDEESKDIIGRITISAERTKEREAKTIPLDSINARLLLDMKKVNNGSKNVFSLSKGVRGKKKGDSYYSMRRSFANVLQKAGISDLHWHDLRHCAATTWKDEGVKNS